MRPTPGAWRLYAKPWCKLLALEAALARMGTASPCGWALVIDSDAFIRADAVDLVRLVGAAAQRVGADVAIHQECVAPAGSP